MLRNLQANQAETSNIDCKEELNLQSDGDRASFVRHIAAFANTGQKSYLLLGVENKTWTPKGIPVDSPLNDVDRTQEQMNDVLHNKTNPSITVAYHTEPNDKVAIGIVEVERKNPPYVICISDSRYGGRKTKGEEGSYINQGAIYIRRATDTVRKQELKRLKRELAQADYQQLKGHLWAFRKNAADLRPDEQACLERLFTYSPVLKTAYTLREELTALFEQAPSPDVAQEQLRTWQARVRQSELHCFDDFLNTLNRWWQEILNYFVNRHSSGFVEGLNNKLKVLKRRCYGPFNLDHLFQRIFLDLEGHRLFT